MKTLLKPKSRPDEQLTSGELADRVRNARDRLAHQHDPALLHALSERELRDNREMAERIRDHERSETLAQVEMAAAASDRVRRTADQLAEQEADELITVRKAIVDARRRHSPQARLAWLHRRREKVLRGLTVIAGFAMIYSAFTVQQNIAPDGGPSNPLFWLSYGLEALISGMLIAIMLTESDTSEDDDKTKLPATGLSVSMKMRLGEAALLAVTLGLNTYPYLKKSEWFNAGVHAIAPVMIGVALVIHNAASERYARSIERITSSMSDTEDDINVRLAALTRITAVPALDADRPAALMPAPAALVRGQTRTDDPHYGVDAEPAPALPGDARTSAGTEPAPAPAVREEAAPAPAPADSEDAAFHSPAAENLQVVRTRTETPHPTISADPEAESARTAVTSGDEQSENTADTGSDAVPVDDGVVAAVRSRTTAETASKPSGALSPAPVRVPASTAAVSMAANPALAVREQEPGWMSPVFELAEEVKARGIAKTKDLELVAAVITAIDAGEKNNAIATAPQTKMSHRTVGSIRQAVAEIRHEHSGGGRVIELRKQDR